MSPARPIAMSDLARQHAPLRTELLSAFERVLDSGHFILGDEVERFERDFAEVCEAPHAIGCASGTDALVLALQALDVGPGQRVLCPAMSFFATASAIVRVGATPVFADVESDGYGLDPASATQVLEAHGPIHAVMVADLFGRIGHLRSMRETVARLEIPLIEDAAQAVGAHDDTGRRAGSCGTIGCFSLYPTKNLGALGDAGIMTTHDADLAARLRRLRMHGVGPDRAHDELGHNSRLDALQAALLSTKLPYLEKWTETRRAHAEFYSDTFASELGSAELTPPRPELKGARDVHHQYVVHVEATRRDALRAHLAGDEIETSVYYATPLHLQPALRDASETPVPLVNAEAAGRRSLALPVHPELNVDDVERVARSVLRFFRGEGRDAS